MILGSHNSWTYLTPKKWWMRLLAFTARCQSKTIGEQYFDYNVRCFDLRVRFDKYGNPVLAHGIIEYDINCLNLDNLNKLDNCIIRVIHEARNREQYKPNLFKKYCENLEVSYPRIKFFCGRNMYNWEVIYNFKNDYTVKECYSSVCKPQLIDDWWPWLFARINNKNISKHIEEDILLVDYVQYIAG